MHNHGHDHDHHGHSHGGNGPPWFRRLQFWVGIIFTIAFLGALIGHAFGWLK